MRAFPVAVCATFLFARVLVAEPATYLTEEQFLEPPAGGHPALAALTSSLGEAEAVALGARVFANPELGASREAPGAVEQLDVSISWQLPHPGRRRHAAAAADARLTAARAELDSGRSALRQTLREVFARWATTTAVAEVLERWSGDLTALAARERERAASGEASALDARRLALAASEASGRLAGADAERLAALAAARAWRADMPANARAELPALPPVGDRGVTTAAHPRLLAAGAELAAARAELELASVVLEMPAVAAGWQRQESAGSAVEGATVGVTWTLPLFDRRVAERSGAAARVAAATARLELAQRDLGARREGAVGAYGTLRAAATAASEAAAAGAGVTAAAKAAFAAGESTVTDLLDALRSVAEAEAAALDLHAEALAAHRHLELLSAEPALLPEP